LHPVQPLAGALQRLQCLALELVELARLRIRRVLGPAQPDFPDFELINLSAAEKIRNCDPNARASARSIQPFGKFIDIVDESRIF
jgi:hypothetical protein